MDRLRVIREFRVEYTVKESLEKKTRDLITSKKTVNKGTVRHKDSNEYEENT